MLQDSVATILSEEDIKDSLSGTLLANKGYIVGFLVNQPDGSSCVE